MHKTMNASYQVFKVIFAALLLSSCAPGRIAPTLTPAPTLPPTLTFTPAPAATLAPTATAVPAPTSTLTIEDVLSGIVKTVCQGKPAGVSGVGTSTAQMGVRLCDNRFQFALPDNWQAASPETLRYVVAVEPNTTSQACSYRSTGGIESAVQLTIPNEVVSIYDVRTGERVSVRQVQGSGFCDQVTTSFPTNQTGFAPTREEVLNAVMELLSPLLPPPHILPTATPVPIPLCAPSFTFKAAASGYPERFYFLQDGKILVAEYSQGKPRLWEVASGREVYTNAPGFTFSSDGKWLATLEDHRVVKIWDIASQRWVSTLEVRDDISQLAFLSDGLLVTVQSLSIVVWDLSSGKEIRVLEPDFEHDYLFFNGAAFSPDGHTLAWEETDGNRRFELMLWDVTGGKEPLSLAQGGHFNFVFTPDGKSLASAPSEGRELTFWDAVHGTLLRTLPLDGELSAFDFLPDGKILVSPPSGASHQLWDAETGREIKPAQNIYDYSVTADGNLLALLTGDEVVTFWDAASRRELRVQKIDRLDEMLISPDGARLATKLRNDAHHYAMLLWDVASGSLVCEAKGQDDYITAYAFSPDGQLLVTGTIDGTVKLWKASGPK